MAISSKATLRRDYVRKRNEIEAALRQQGSGFIRHRLFQLPAWQKATTLLTYVSFGSEVDTYKIIQEAFLQHKRVVVPCVDPVGTETSLSELKNLGDLAPGPRHHIPETGEAFRKRVSHAEIQLALVPALSYDRTGARLGRGGGYYDRLIPKLTNAVCIGLAFSDQLNPESLPTEPHDRPVHTIITEQELIEISTLHIPLDSQGAS